MQGKNVLQHAMLATIAQQIAMQVEIKLMNRLLHDLCRSVQRLFQLVIESGPLVEVPSSKDLMQWCLKILVEEVLPRQTLAHDML